jgi:hypothetical protein
MPRPNVSMQDHLRRESWLVVAFLAFATAAWLMLAGKDLSWDFLNHQLYLPFSLLSGRFSTDLLAAGPQSYQNPIGYLPMYALVMSKLPAYLVGLCLALTVSAMQVWALLSITHRVFGTAPTDRDWRVLAIAMSFAAPVHMLMIGGTSNDPLCAGLTLVPLALVLDPACGRRAVAVAGLCLGLAIAIKPTSLVFGIPTALIAVFHVLSHRWPLARLAQGVVWAVLAFAIAGGLWAYWLWLHFDNPTFPLLNQVFKTPLAPTGVTIALRFLPQSGWDWLTRPLSIVQFRAFVSVEAFAPDLRPAAALFASAFAIVVFTMRRGIGAWMAGPTWLRPDVQLAAYLTLAYFLWMLTSGNARYAISWFMLAGLVLVRAVQCVSRHRRAQLALLVLLGVQLGNYVAFGDRRLSSQAWTAGPYASFEIPARLRTTPVLHLSLGVQSYAALATELQREGAFINLQGQMSIPNKGPLADRLEQQLSRWKGRTRFLFAPRHAPGSPGFAKSIDGTNWLLMRRFGLRVDINDCEMIRILGPDDMPSGDARQTAPQTTRDPFTRRLLSCAAVNDSIKDPQFERALASANQIFDLLEANCPLAFGPIPMTTDANPAAFWRLYMNSGAVIEISEKEGVVASYHRASEPIYLGKPREVLANGGKDACVAWKKLLSQ